MNRSVGLTEKHKKTLLALQALLLLAVSSYWWLPQLGIPAQDWLAAIGALTCLIGMLLVFWRSGALRGWFVVAFIGVLLIAPGLVWFFSHT